MKKNFSKNQSGTSLIEVIVAMFIVFVLFLLYLAALNTTTLIKENNNEDLAYHIANKQMEALREIPYATLINTAGTNISDTQINSLPAGSGSYTISDVTGMSGVKEFVVTVSWNDGRARSVVLRTYSGSGGLNP